MQVGLAGHRSELQWTQQWAPVRRGIKLYPYQPILKMYSANHHARDAPTCQNAIIPRSDTLCRLTFLSCGTAENAGVCAKALQSPAKQFSVPRAKSGPTCRTCIYTEIFGESEYTARGSDVSCKIGFMSLSPFFSLRAWCSNTFPIRIAVLTN